jgi:hypothetical protein
MLLESHMKNLNCATNYYIEWNTFVQKGKNLIYKTMIYIMHMYGELIVFLANFETISSS